jgi:hypothetical protein
LLFVVVVVVVVEMCIDCTYIIQRIIVVYLFTVLKKFFPFLFVPSSFLEPLYLVIIRLVCERDYANNNHHAHKSINK